MQVTERDEAGHVSRISFQDRLAVSSSSSQTSLLTALAKLFLPAGYPHSVSPDYLRYQILNALQAFCNSLASLLSSRATLEGYGVGDASASATDALLLTVLQDLFGRLTTIIAAFFFGSSLFPEAKTYRFLADVLNDAATVIDTLSPLLTTIYLSHAPAIFKSLPFLPPSVPFRVYTLCFSASLRALCGIAAGGSKTAITMHFATPLQGSGDVGDLNAKDSSKETVLAMLGMMIGSLTVPYLTTPCSTYTVLFLTVLLHLLINYLGVRGVVLRTLNRQRASLAWLSFKSDPSLLNTPSRLASLERILSLRSDAIRSFPSGKVIASCTLGSKFSTCLPNSDIVGLFRNKRYVLCLDRNGTLVAGSVQRFHILLKHGYNSADQLEAWVLACEAARLLASSTIARGSGAATLFQEAIASVDRDFHAFIEDLRKHDWITVPLTRDSQQSDDEYAPPAPLLGSQTISFSVAAPRTVILNVQYEAEGKKTR
ncbi:hypothetical protein D9757_008111 [Collybiopsis confluens]|uniref:Protein root UVB sensitive/RUS domain-containing protein n=1 Tax=Collybiopsis confluens TaxID=2823264 RepID=A0A8H5H6Z6_9AGAR|nr:hypothetical protein D9757_008111 [Collybiopsis confluens]